MKGIFAGIVGSFTALCCAGFPLFLAFLTGIGLGFLINDLVLFPILFVAIGFMLYSLHYHKKKHLSSAPLYVGILAAILVLIGIFLGSIIWIGIVGLFVATLWDYSLVRRRKK